MSGVIRRCSTRSWPASAPQRRAWSCRKTTWRWWKVDRPDAEYCVHVRGSFEGQRAQLGQLLKAPAVHSIKASSKVREFAGHRHGVYVLTGRLL